MAKAKITSARDLPVMPLTIEDMTWNKTGTWRLLTPVQKDKTAPCRAACPIGQPVPGFIGQMADEDPAAALGVLMSHNPLPGVTGRLCYHPCQGKCLRRELDQAVSIQGLERVISDVAEMPAIERKPDSGKRVAVCGAGPAGLTAAFFLGLEGHQVAVLDPADSPGGFLTQAKADKLPPEILAREVERLTGAAGLQMACGVAEADLKPFDLVLVDQSAYAQGSPEAQALGALAGEGDNRLIMAPDKEAGFKPSQVAHAVDLGRRLASVANQALGLEAFYQKPDGEQVVTAGEMSFERFAPAAPPAEGKELTAEQAAAEAARCMSCGTCNLCQNCALTCPDGCCNLDIDQGLITFDLYHCKGCGVCAYECPRGALVMENLQ
jgi:Pyruvate/2-oxoacid:ferredoxin oxidoreductase delta subunit